MLRDFLSATISLCEAGKFQDFLARLDGKGRRHFVGRAVHAEANERGDFSAARELSATLQAHVHPESHFHRAGHDFPINGAEVYSDWN
jgi:hypothetical protein